MWLSIKQHIGLAQWQARRVCQRYFNHEVLAYVAERIQHSERQHQGELMVAVEAVQPSHEPDSALRALEVYGRLGVWDTPLNSGVLLYISLDQRRIEIVADRGITASSEQWASVCTKLRQAFSRKQYIDGLLQAVDEIESVLLQHAPAAHMDVPAQNYLPDAPVIL